MVRSVHEEKAILLLSFLILLAGCNTTREGYTPPVAYETLPALFQRNGMINSSTYQVTVTTHATTEEKARVNGEILARTAIFELMATDSFIRTHLSEYGQKRLKDLIELNGRIVRIAHESPDRWSIAFQVNRVGLIEFLQGLR